jgi:hypothetical protein
MGKWVIPETLVTLTVAINKCSVIYTSCTGRRFVEGWANATLFVITQVAVICSYAAILALRWTGCSGVIDYLLIPVTLDKTELALWTLVASNGWVIRASSGWWNEWELCGHCRRVDTGLIDHACKVRILRSVSPSLITHEVRMRCTIQQWLSVHCCDHLDTGIPTTTEP